MPKENVRMTNLTNQGFVSSLLDVRLMVMSGVLGGIRITRSFVSQSKAVTNLWFVRLLTLTFFQNIKRSKARCQANKPATNTPDIPWVCQGCQ